MEQGLLSPEDIRTEQAFEEKRKILYKTLHQLKHKQTPKKHQKVRSDGKTYTDYAYMLDEMDKYHPLREETGKLEVIPNVGWIVGTVQVKDLTTGEIRIGVDAHRMTVGKGEKLSQETLKDLGNDCKSAITEALRNAYSRFGVSTDVYRKVMVEDVTAEQISEFEEVVKIIIAQGGSDIWADQQRGKFKECETKQKAAEFINKLKTFIKESK